MALTPAQIGGLISGGSNIVDTGVNAILQGAQNKKNRKFAEKMYNRQRADALSDWNLQNSYNAPSAQMERLKAAKLNPNLIYGTGTQAAGLSTPVRSSSASTPQGTAPQVSLGSGITAYYDTQLKQTQRDVGRSVVELNEERKRQIIADTLMKGANTGLINTKNAAESFKLGLQQSLKDITLETADWNLRGMKADVSKTYTQIGTLEAQRILTQDENGRRERLTNANIAQKLSTMALQAEQVEATKAGVQLTNARKTQVYQMINNALKTKEGIELKNQLMQSELDYQTIERTKAWLQTIIGAAKK